MLLWGDGDRFHMLYDVNIIILYLWWCCFRTLSVVENEVSNNSSFVGIS